MATLSVGTTARTGLVATGVTPGGSGDEFANTGVECALIRNGSGAPVNVTIDFKAAPDGATVTDPVVAVAAGAITLIGPFPPAYYNDSSTGRVKLTCSATTDVTISVFKLGST